MNICQSCYLSQNGKKWLLWIDRIAVVIPSVAKPIVLPCTCTYSHSLYLHQLLTAKNFDHTYHCSQLNLLTTPTFTVHSQNVHCLQLMSSLCLHPLLSVKLFDHFDLLLLLIAKLFDHTYFCCSQLNFLTAPTSTARS